ncbi:MAG: hypothetical protein J6N73_05205 [Prevotella sp.]|nr:hypothetical protein [Prevotella sp.]
MKYYLLLIMCSIGLTANAQRVSILGDSYSTFEDFMTPETNELWYYAKNAPEKTDVNRVQDTWWWQLIKNNGMRLCVNNSYSGATIGYQGYDGNDYSPRTFIKRMRNLGDPDIILIFGGTNDSWAGEPVGEYKYEGWQYGDFYTYRPAMAYMLDWLKNHHPNVDIYVIINNDLRADITESTKTICDHYGITYIQLKDIDKISGHPSVKGMKAIAEQVAAVVCKR